MLERLRVENFALIEEAELELSPGMNLLTGETGAGKSLVIDAVGLLIGGRATADVVRAGADKARMEGLFRLPEGDGGKLRRELEELGVEVEEDDSLLLTREIARGGKSVCRINGRSAPLSLYREVGGRLIDLQGQHEQQSLMNPRKHRVLLDRLAGSDGEKALAAVEAAYRALDAVEKERERLQQGERDRIQRQDMLAFQVKEIDGVQLVEGEEEELDQERKRLLNMEKLMDKTNAAYDALFGGQAGGALELLDRARTAVEEAAAFDPALSALVQNLEAAYYQAEDAAERLRDYRQDLEYQPDRLETVDDRLDAIRRLKRKYGGSIGEILAYREEIARELEELEHRDERIAELQAEAERRRKTYQDAAAKLSALRKKMAAKLETSMAKELAFLGMNRAKLAVRLDERPEPSAAGAEEVEFLFTPNPGEPPKPLAKIASGGETGRILLAFKTLLARVEGIPSLIFDEIDAGIGGQALQAVAQKMAEVAEAVQVICVTHAPQLAAYADNHFRIMKTVRGQRTITRIEALNEEERVKELARMLGGDRASTLTHSHAREMFAQAKKSS
ncbi:DNA repair protein RecN [Heliobacterium undosum]|uniref:DNA repair protein RecN n=1 Tax=Heliomicrobium undosum TaxID=121734 RepID=A0A845L0K2_9FIRM|nr:DNA repair protein RecN [Heliomicrobium undosum]MZP28439.1 DNA repair protein RecN [Heliomicrobium undosum]